MSTPGREALITRQAAARQLGIHPNTMDKIAKDSGLSRYRLIGDTRIYFLRTDIAQIDPIVEVA